MILLKNVQGLGATAPLQFALPGASLRDIRVNKAVQESFLAQIATQVSPQVLESAIRPPPPGPVDEKCACLVEKLGQFAAQQGIPFGAAEQSQAMGTCATDKAQFTGLLKQLGVSVAACKPWYMRPTTWAIGGAAVLGGVVLLGRRRR